MKKMGGMEGVMSMLPGVNKMKAKMDQANIDEKMLVENEAIILSMTKNERENPKIISGSRRKRICLLYTSPSPRDRTRSRMPSSA